MLAHQKKRNSITHPEGHKQIKFLHVAFWIICYMYVVTYWSVLPECSHRTKTCSSFHLLWLSFV